MSPQRSKPYVIDSDQKPMRLEKQARIAKIEGHLNKFFLSPDATVLDAGCGSGAMTRLLAQRASQGHVTGIDRNERYLAFARSTALEAGFNNVTFAQGNIFHLPLADETFDFVWCKYLLQWVNNPLDAVREFKRAVRPGGTVVCCHFDGFRISHYPVDPGWQNDAERFFTDVIDPYIGRKMYWLFHHAGFGDIVVDSEPDALFWQAEQ